MSSYLYRCRESPAPGSSPACRIAWAARSRAPCSSSWARPPRPAPPRPASRGHYSADHDHNHSAILIFTWESSPLTDYSSWMNRVCRSCVNSITRFMTVVPVVSIVVSDWLIVCFSGTQWSETEFAPARLQWSRPSPPEAAGCCCWGGFTRSKGRMFPLQGSLTQLSFTQGPAQPVTWTQHNWLTAAAARLVWIRRKPGRRQSDR